VYSGTGEEMKVSVPIYHTDGEISDVHFDCFDGYVSITIPDGVAELRRLLLPDYFFSDGFLRKMKPESPEKK
jgi:hypothetical protein